MDWFKQNPFLAVLALVTAVVGGVAFYFLLSASSELTVQQDEYAAQTSGLRRMQDAKPFPDEAAVKLAEEESAKAAALLKDLEAALADQTAPIDSALTPQGFQDKLSAATATLDQKAAEKGTILPENFYLGFEQYRAQPPPGEAAPLLGQQLESISGVVSLLVDAGVKSITAVSRPPLSSEAGVEQTEDAGKDEDKPQLVLAPFDVDFISDQSVFREALAEIINVEPLIVVRLLSVANSRPTAPAKDAPGAEPNAADATPEGAEVIPVLFGQETIAVTMRLAAPSGAPSTGQK